MRRVLPFLLFLFILAALLRVDFFFTTAYLFFAVYVLARLWTRRSLKQVRVQRQFTNRAFSGDEVTVRVLVRNTGRLPIPWLQAHESLPVDLATPPFHVEVFSLGPREQRHFSYALHCRKRGVYPVGPLRAQTGDLLGIEEPDSLEAAPDHLIVYPRILPLGKLDLPTRSPLVALHARAPLFEDPARVTGVRDYQRGDSPRRIHWTATASAGRLLVKQYQPAIARETLICLDLDVEGYDPRRRYDATELAIVIAASIANHIVVRERLPVGLMTEALDPLLNERARLFLPPRPERAHLMSLLEALARVQVTRAAPVAEILRRQRPRLAWGVTLIVVTGRESEALYDTLAHLQQAGFAVALILVQAARAPAETQARAAVLKIRVHRVWNERDLEQWR